MLWSRSEGPRKAFIMKFTGKSIDQLKVGDSAEWSRTVTEDDIKLFAEATGDFNPVHLDQTYAEKTFFKARIAHGLLSLGYISTVLGNILPGHGTIYISQEVKFLAPVKIGDTITAKVEVMEVNPDKNRVRFKTICLNQEGKIVLDGAAWVMPPKRE